MAWGKLCVLSVPPFPLYELGIIIVTVHGVVVMINLDNQSKELCQCLAHTCSINVSSSIPNI